MKLKDAKTTIKKLPFATFRGDAVYMFARGHEITHFELHHNNRVTTAYVDNGKILPAFRLLEAMVLVRCGILLQAMVNTTGPVKHSVNNSTLSVIKDWLLGHKQKMFDPFFRIFGREFHKQSLEPHKRKTTVGAKAEDKRIAAMVKSLAANALFKMLFKDSRKEHLVKGTYCGVKVHGTLDINKQRTKQGGDPKTTATTSEAKFIESVIKYGYPRQGVLYSAIAKLNEFYFFGIGKKYPYPVWVFDLNNPKHKSVVRYYTEELIFLLYFFKHYGVPIDKDGKSIAVDKSATQKSVSRSKDGKKRK